MKTIIFKSEKRANTYQVISLVNQGCYKENELLYTVKTDDINRLLENGQLKVTAKKVS